MSDKLVDRRDIEFLLHEVLNVEALVKYPYFAEHSRETFDMALDSAYDLAREVFWPTYRAFDAAGVAFDGKQAKAPKEMKAIWKACQEGGWFAPIASYENGGAQFPVSVYICASFMFNAANTAAAMYTGQATGAGLLLETFGSDELKGRFMHKLYSGEWAGTMALTEPQAGTSLSDIKTSAKKAPDGDYYYIHGTKRFISSGDHDITGNIIHPTLARIEGAPPGTKGISLFIVPKFRVKPDGSVGEFNDVKTGGIEHKMGLKGQATATLNFGDDGKCIGYLLGEPNRGLHYMFQLMNNARVHTGIQAIAQASNAYQHAVDYARTRAQGRKITSTDPTSPQVPIIEHADVRRMLLTQKAYVEGVTALLVYCGYLGDLHQVAESEDERTRTFQLLEILTPICKAYASDVAFESINLAMQCYGGSGYMEDYPIAQMLRDNRVFSIYEGTNSIQAMDLLGRKVAMEQGAYFRRLLNEIYATIADAKTMDSLKPLALAVESAVEQCMSLTLHLGQIGMSGDVDLYLSHATAYLRIFSQLVIAWLFLWEATVAARKLAAGENGSTYYDAKIATAAFYINTILPTSGPLANTIVHGDRSALDFKPEWF